MATTWGLTDAGFIAPRTEDFLTIIREKYETNTGLTINWDYDAVLGNITKIMSEQLGDLGDALQALADQMDPNNATGLQLENIGLLRGVVKKKATYSTATVTLGGTAGTLVEEGSLVEDTENGLRWEVQDDTTLVLGSGTVVVQCTTAGAVVATADTITKIVTPIDGWTSVTNADDATPGEDEEDDDDYRIRQQLELQISGAGNVAAIRAAILQVEGVTAAKVLQNTDAITATVEGVSLEANCIRAIVYPDTLEDDVIEAIVTILWILTPAATKITGTDVTATVVGEDDEKHDVAFDYAEELETTAEIEVTLEENFSLEDVEQDIKDIVVAFFAALTIGEEVSRYQISVDLGVIDGIKDLTITLNGIASNVVTTGIQIAVIIEDDITVTEAA